jgi:hypothetical protein
MAATTTVLNVLPTAATTPSRKRKIIADPTTSSMGHKRSRTWTELEYEEMMEEATLLREELELLVAVAADLCRDLACDPSHAHAFLRQLAAIEEKMSSTEDLTERQVREMCQQMITMMKYMCQRHYDHFAMVDMQDHLRDSRDRFMRFICQYATMISLFH